ncbi:hypothetical protein DFH06DRAFT_659684, partial [Mycena polygramma]
GKVDVLDQTCTRRRNLAKSTSIQGQLHAGRIRSNQPSTAKRWCMDSVVVDPSSASTPIAPDVVHKKRKYTRKAPQTSGVLNEAVLDPRPGVMPVDGAVLEPSASKDRQPTDMAGTALDPSSAVAEAPKKRKYTRKAAPKPEEAFVVELPSVSTPTDTVVKKRPYPRKIVSQSFAVTLVHGDVLFLSGDDFEYSIARSGTSILLVALGQ